MRKVSEADLKSLEQGGGRVRRRPKARAATDEVKKSAPPPGPELRPPETASGAPKVDKQVVTLVEAQNQLMTRNTEALMQLGESMRSSLAEAVASRPVRGPVPWKFQLIRSKKGFIDSVEATPQITDGD